ncbi:hypothetical protein AQI95_36510 [Streptomyces yokosukanensis]|uniref:DUF742 domain-containing protein n=1 Tax=Streptomyces yokosukanensis TaxID=67386 RepID=A0A124HE97_9ACTN|nr:DUF742 domain-containing protein [Streptomyces yokosukanensis]KUN00014.1 hypothetical protein AQI95_36510 [Streptomyces yokosukanensis]
MTAPRRKRREPKPPPPPQPPQPQPQPPEQADGEAEPKNPERLYTVAGSEDGARAELDLVTLIVARSAPQPAASPEQGSVLRLCTNPLSVAELSAYLNLPFSAMTVLITEMITAELVQARSPIARQSVPDRSILEAVMHGLQRL